jgi:hyperosmotically inducible periplasmic protein
MSRTVKIALLAAALAAAPTAAVFARADDVKRAVKRDAKELWLESKVKYHLITADDVPAGPIHVEVSGGVVTLHGKVETQAEKARAEEVVRKIDGVREVKNLLQVVPKSRKQVVKANDNLIKDRIEKTLKADKRFEDIHLESVDNGVVRLGGKASLASALRAVETVAAIPGVRHVSSSIEVSDKG